MFNLPILILFHIHQNHEIKVPVQLYLAAPNEKMYEVTNEKVILIIAGFLANYFLTYYLTN